MAHHHPAAAHTPRVDEIWEISPVAASLDFGHALQVDEGIPRRRRRRGGRAKASRRLAGFRTRARRELMLGILAEISGIALQVPPPMDPFFVARSHDDDPLN